MDTNISALMARIQEIQARMQEIRGMTARGITSTNEVKGPDSAIPPRAAETADTGGSSGEFSVLLEKALGELGQGGSSGVVEFMSSALDSLSSLTGSEEGEESDFLMSRDNLTRLTELERVLRGRLGDSTFEE